jgi:hypothetical protein
MTRSSLPYTAPWIAQIWILKSKKAELRISSGTAVAVDAARGGTSNFLEKPYRMIPNRSSSEKRSLFPSFAKSASPVAPEVFRELFALEAGILDEQSKLASPAHF